jgi:Pregnancy-associated plasma protein-A
MPFGVTLLATKNGDVQNNFSPLNLNEMKFQFSSIILAFSIIFSQPVSAQRNCGSAVDMSYIRINSPSIYQNILDFNRQVQTYKNASSTRGPDDILLIPVVVHVVYNTSAQNISYEKIQSQIDVLNEDFNRTNLDASNTPSAFQAVAANPKIRFKLACVGPTGATTIGIIRIQTTVVQFTIQNKGQVQSSMGTNQAVGDDPWPTDKYLNIWVCNLEGGYSFGFIPDLRNTATYKDGVVIHYQLFGRNTGIAHKELGRTCTHEVGHWLNCFHIYNQFNCTDSDMCDDTPNQYNFNSGCPSYPHPSCNNTSDMFMNYMDYTDDECENLFTNDQKARMRTLFEPGGFRYSIINNNNALQQITRYFQPQGGGPIVALKQTANGTNDIGGTSSSYTPIVVDECDKIGPISWRILSNRTADIIINGENASVRLTKTKALCQLEATIPRANGGTKVESYSFYNAPPIPDFPMSPNPAPNDLRIQQKAQATDVELLTDPFSAKMYNAGNTLVRAGQGNNGQLVFDVANLPRGNYQVVIETFGRFVNKQIVIQR